LTCSQNNEILRCAGFMWWSTRGPFQNGGIIKSNQICVNKDVYFFESLVAPLRK